MSERSAWIMLCVVLGMLAAAAVALSLAGYN